MREIKFRAWDKINNIMFNVARFDFADYTIYARLFGEPIDANDCILEQYTGLKDKNGVEIYEGDKCIVERPCVGAVGKIKFHQGCFIFEKNHTENILGLCDLKLNNYTIEVIGNIHENKEV